MKSLKTNEPKKEVKPMTEVCALWLKKKNDGVGEYLTGLDNEKANIKGFFNKEKKNPKEPDVRICSVDEKGNATDEIVALWSTVGKKGSKYLYGKTKSNENVVGFYGEEYAKTPYIRVYFRENDETLQ